jgi:uncharacterized protein YggT (Ycf19 family)
MNEKKFVNDLPMYALIVYVIQLVLFLAEAVLLLRFLLKLFGANSQALFAKWVYETSTPLLQPFADIFPTSSQGFFTLEFSTLFAMVVYSIIGYVLVEMLGLFNRSHRR